MDIYKFDNIPCVVMKLGCTAVVQQFSKLRMTYDYKKEASYV